MTRPARPDARVLAPAPALHWLAALMIGTAIAAFTLTAEAQTAAPEQPAAAAAAPAAGDAAAGAAGAQAAPAEGSFRQAGGAIRNAEAADIGSVLLTETASGVIHVVVDISEGGLPAAQHAIHIHETGTCEGPTFESAGGHLAGGKQHGIHSPNGIHSGDLPNITMGKAGALHVEYFLPGVLLDDILDADGSAVVVHADVDDYTTQPSGNAGDRIACGVLELTS